MPHTGKFNLNIFSTEFTFSYENQIRLQLTVMCLHLISKNVRNKCKPIEFTFLPQERKFAPTVHLY